MSEYRELLKHPQWQKRRLELFQAADFECRRCKSRDDQLHAHHIYYRKGKDPWEYADDEFLVLCDSCHEHEHAVGDEAWRDLKREVIAAGGMADDVAYLADAFLDKPKLERHEWPALGRCLRTVLELHYSGKDLSDVARMLDEQKAGWDPARDDEGYAAWAETGKPEAVEQ